MSSVKSALNKTPSLEAKARLFGLTIISVKAVHPIKAVLSILSTFSGMSKLVRDTHPEKAPSSIIRRFAGSLTEVRFIKFPRAS